MQRQTRCSFTSQATSDNTSCDQIKLPRCIVSVAHYVTALRASPKRIFDAADRLAEFPRIGHLGAVPGTYQWTVQGLPFIIVHEMDDEKDELIVLGVFHGAQVR
jgi:plasmid stabilization system protein ParE